MAYRLRAFHELVRNLIEGAWVRFVQKLNADKPCSTTDLGTFLFGEERAGLEAYRPILLDVQEGTCLYSRNPLSGNRSNRPGGRVRLERLDRIGPLAEGPDIVPSRDELLARPGAEDAAATPVARLRPPGLILVAGASVAVELSRAVVSRNRTYARAWAREALEK